MSKKQYFILSPACSLERTKDLKEKASAYFGQKEYEEAAWGEESQDLLMQTLEKILDINCNSDLLLTGMSIVAMSKCDSIYVSKDWEQDDMCKICHMLAFSHGMDLIYEPI